MGLSLTITADDACSVCECSHRFQDASWFYKQFIIIIIIIIGIYSRWLKCCFTSTETIGLLGMGAQDIHLNFHTAPEL